MLAENDRAFKEWAVACEAMRAGRQILLIRKGGIREEGGGFAINDREFFLMPTYEHQQARLLRPEFAAGLEAIQAAPRDFQAVTMDAYAVVDSIQAARNEEQVNAVLYETIWNEIYVKERFDFNPYDPLYLILLRVYRLSAPLTVPMQPEYEGCKSWVTLERAYSLAGADPVLSDVDFARRREKVASLLAG